MSFREKSAWITLTAILLVSVLFFLHGPELLDPNPTPWTLHAAAACIGAFIAIEVFFVLFAFVIAEIVNYATRIIYFRRGF